MLKSIHKSVVRYFKAYSVNAVYLTCPQIVAAISSIVTLPIILGNIPGSEYGKMQFILAIFGWLSVFTFARISAESKIGIAKGYEGNFFYAIFTRLKLSIPVIIFCLLASISFLYFDKKVLGVISLMATASLIVNNIVNNSISQLLVAKELFHYFAWFGSITLLMRQIASAIAACYTHNIIYMFSARLCASFVIVVITLFLLLKR